MQIIKKKVIKVQQSRVFFKTFMTVHFNQMSSELRKMNVREGVLKVVAHITLVDNDQ